MSGESGGDAKLSVRAAARLWDVTRSTVHEWRTTGRVRIFRMGAHGFETTLAEVRSANVLVESSILQGPVTERDLATAVREGKVVAVEGRYSLDDRDYLRQLAKSRLNKAESEPVRHSSGMVVAIPKR
jgi:hypothetical protein